MKKTYEREIKKVHDLKLHDGPLGFISHTPRWYSVVDDKCPNCGVTPEFETYTVEEVEDKPKKKQ